MTLVVAPSRRRRVTQKPLRTRIYALHRWIGLVVSLQLLAWALGGVVFSVFAMDNVRGDRERRREPRALVTGPVLAPADALARGGCGSNFARLTLYTRAGRPVYEFIDSTDKRLCTVDASSGERRDELSADEATQLARTDFAPEARVLSVVRIERDPPIEYRGKPLPAYQVVFDNPKHTHVYVSATSGEIAARRNSVWRLYDFFWMLHVMDYRGRDDHSHALLTVASVLAATSALSGIVLHGYRWASRRRGRASSPSVA